MVEARSGKWHKWKSEMVMLIPVGTRVKSWRIGGPNPLVNIRAKFFAKELADVSKGGRS